MLKTITTFILSLSFISIMAQSEIPSKDYLEWGSIHIPLNELVNGTNARIKLKREDILASASAPMILYKNGKDAKLESFSMFITKENRTASPQFINVQNYDSDDAMDTHGKPFLKEHLYEGEYIYLNKLKGKDGEEHFITIQILYKNPPLILDFKLPVIPKGEVFGFQIQEMENQKSIVKLDTTDEKNSKIFNTYKNYDSYEVFHITNFKTTRRYLTKKDFLDIPNETVIDLVADENINNINLNLIPEFSNYDKKIIELKWGEMQAIDDPKTKKTWTLQEAATMTYEERMERPKFDNYDLLDALGSRFLLSQGFQSYDIQRMKVVLSNQNNNPISYITDDINNSKLTSILEKLEPNTIILITDILIKNSQGESIYFPPSFMFKIESTTEN